MFTIGLGGGCHWCTEAVIQAIPGVSLVNQGYIASTPPNERFSEAVMVTCHASINLALLIDVHLETHASAAMHSRRDIYRSAIYYTDKAQKIAIEAVMCSLSRKRNKKYITALLPLFAFKPSRDAMQDYFKTRPDAPFCKKYIEPKLAVVQSLLKNS